MFREDSKIRETLIRVNKQNKIYNTFNDNDNNTSSKAVLKESIFNFIIDDILHTIFIHLDISSKANFKRVCNRFNNIAAKYDKIFWENPEVTY